MGAKSRGLKQTSVSKHTPELPRLRRLEVRLGTRSLCHHCQAPSPSRPAHPPLTHEQGQSCQGLQGRAGPGSYLDLGCVAGPALSMQGGLHL